MKRAPLNETAPSSPGTLPPSMAKNNGGKSNDGKSNDGKPKDSDGSLDLTVILTSLAWS